MHSVAKQIYSMLQCIFSEADHNHDVNDVVRAIRKSGKGGDSLRYHVFDVFCDLEVNTRTATWNLPVLYIKDTTTTKIICASVVQ